MTIANAQTVNSDYESVKVDIMAGIPAGNIDSAIDTSIANGAGNVFQKTWYGPQGFALWENITGDDRSDWAWTHSSFKVANKSVSDGTPDPHTEYALLTQKQYQDVWGLGKRFWVPQTCYATVRVSADIISPRLNEWGNLYRSQNFSGRTPSETYMFINGVKQQHTKHLAREESIGTSPTGEPDFIITSTLNSPTSNLMRRYYSCFITVAFSAGWNEIQVKTDCRTERTYASRRSIHIDAFYV